MTDKVHKIKEWISKTQDGLMDDNGNFKNTSDEEAFHILSNLDYYIDTLQEEPVSEQNLSNVQRIGKNWKEEPVSIKDKLRALSDGKQHLGWLDDANALEEPINKELDRFIKEHGPMATLEKCAAHFAEWGKKHSNLFVSDDLEEAVNAYIGHAPEVDES
jgi:hypothetical protein